MFPCKDETSFLRNHAVFVVCEICMICGFWVDDFWLSEKAPITYLVLSLKPFVPSFLSRILTFYTVNIFFASLGQDAFVERKQIVTNGRIVVNI